MPTVADRAQCLRILAQVRPQLYAHNNGAGRLLRATRAVADPDLGDELLVWNMSELCDALAEQSAASTQLALAAVADREPTDIEATRARTAAFRARNILWLLLHGPDAYMCSACILVPTLPAETIGVAGRGGLCGRCREEAGGPLVTDGITVDVAEVVAAGGVR